MSNVFSKPAYDISQELKSRGIDFPHSYVIETMAASFCYRQYKEFLPNIERIGAELQDNGAIAILQPEQTRKRVLDLLDVPKRQQRGHYPIANEIVGVIHNKLSATMPQSIYPNEESFGESFLVPHVRSSIENDAYKNVQRAQDKVIDACGNPAIEFDVDEVELPDLNNKRETQWTCNVLSQLLQTDAEGKAQPHDEKVLLNVEATFEKLDRCIVAPDFNMRVVVARAIRPDPACGGILL